MAIVSGVALFMGGGETSKAKNDDSIAIPYQVWGIAMISISLCFDGGLGAYEDRIVAQYKLQSLDLMYKLNTSNVLLATATLIVTNQLDQLALMWREMGYMILALGFTAAMGSIFIFLTITRYGSLTCSIMGLARKVTTICASIYVYGHTLTSLQLTGLLLSVGAMAYKPLQEYLSIQRNSPTALMRHWQSKFFPANEKEENTPNDDESQFHREQPFLRPIMRRLLFPLGLSFLGLAVISLGPQSLSQFSPSLLDFQAPGENVVNPQAAPMAAETSTKAHLRKPAVPPT